MCLIGVRNITFASDVFVWFGLYVNEEEEKKGEVERSRRRRRRRRRRRMRCV